MAQKKKVSQFLKAYQAYNNGEIKTVREAIKFSGLSPTTYYKYLEELGVEQNSPSISTAPKLADNSDQIKKLAQENAKLKEIIINMELRNLQ